MNYSHGHTMLGIPDTSNQTEKKLHTLIFLLTFTRKFHLDPFFINIELTITIMFQIILFLSKISHLITK